MTEQEQFMEDLAQFISNHEYYKSNEGSEIHTPSEDKVDYEISDPDGHFERLIIRLIGIS